MRVTSCGVPGQRDAGSQRTATGHGAWRFAARGTPMPRVPSVANAMVRRHVVRIAARRAGFPLRFASRRVASRRLVESRPRRTAPRRTGSRLSPALARALGRYATYGAYSAQRREPGLTSRTYAQPTVTFRSFVKRARRLCGLSACARPLLFSSPRVFVASRRVASSTYYSICRNLLPRCKRCRIQSSPSTMIGEYFKHH